MAARHSTHRYSSSQSRKSGRGTGSANFFCYGGFPSLLQGVQLVMGNVGPQDGTDIVGR